MQRPRKHKRMKRIVNILSCLWLLLLTLVVACSDFEEIVINMQGEEEVELTIRTNVPGLGGSTRTAPTENITNITALAFDSDKKLIKVAIEDVTTSPSANPSISGTYTVKVPVRTRRIHFIAKNDGVFDTFSTEADYGKSDEELLKDHLTTNLHYWGKLDFSDAEALKAGGDVTLYRNMAKLELTLPTDVSGYIAGFLNYNTDGTIAAYSEKDTDFLYLTDKTSTHYLPATHTNNDEEDKYKDAQTKPLMEYLFEEENNNGDYVYVICNIAGKYYKIAFAYADANGDPVYFPIVRNHSYTINIKEGYDTTYGVGHFEEAIDAAPINATAQEEVEFIFDYETIIMFIEDRTCEIAVTIPEGITQLKVLPVNIFTIQSIEPELTLGDNDLYIVTPGAKYTFTLKLDESHTETGKAPVRFIGNGVGKVAHKDVEVKLRRKATIAISPEERTINNTQGSNCYFDVTIPANIDNFVIEAGEAFAVTSVATLNTTPVEPNDDGSYTVTNATYRVTLTLKDDAVGQTGDYPIHFVGTSEYWGAEGTATITLQEYVAQDLDVYEMWFENNTWNGSQDYDVFFTHEGEMITTGEYATNLENTFYDPSADNHKSQAMVMGSDDSFTFTIPEGSNRWLTLLVASDGSSTPSIQLSNGTWATASSSDAVVPNTYNFGNGEINTAGRLIRYELKPGTYTLQGSDAAYLLYYMRVTKTKPTMTDIAQPELTDYELAWSGGQYANTEGKGYLKISDAKHIVDEDNLTHTVSLKAENSLKNSLNLSNTLSTFDLTVATTRVTFTNENENTYNGDKSVTKDYNNQTNSCSLDTHNAGNYTLKGTINSPAYKYSAFYDKLLLDAVEYEVKSPIKPGLYNSMDGRVLTPVEGFTSMDAAWAIGFKMPMVVPISASELLPYDANNPKYKNYTIDINIPNWTLSTDGDARGLGVIENSTGNYTLGTQENANGDTMIHPREGWTYKIKWASIAGESITPELTDEEDTDHYFTYKGTIDKKVTIPTPYTETALNITLDFYTENGVDFNNLTFGETKFYLKATIPSGIPAGRQIMLNLVTEGREGISEHHSRDADSSKGISYHYTNDVVDGLVITTAENQTEYLMCWKYVRSDENNTNDVTITYTVTSGTHTLNGEETATITIKGNSQAGDNPLSIALDFYSDTENRNDNNYTNLKLEESHFYLKANISQEDATKYAGQQVQLQGRFTSPYQYGNHQSAIHWDNSRQGNSNMIYYGDNHDGTGLQFTINNGQTEYLMEWVFDTGDNYAGYGDIEFTYTISNNQGYHITGDTQATIAFTNEPTNTEPDITDGTTIWTGSQQWGDWSADGYQPNYLAINYFLPEGTEITLNVTSANGGAVEMHDCTLASLRLASSDVTYPDQGDDYFNVSSGNTSPKFIVPSGGVNGLRINGSNVTITSVVVKYPNVTGEIFSRDFNDNNAINGWGGEGHVAPTAQDGVLVLTNNNSGFAQAAVDMGYVPGSYTLSYRIQGTVSGSIKQNFQHYYSPKNADGSNGNDVYDEDINNPKDQVTQFATEWREVKVDITISKGANRLLFDYSSFTGTIYIDDLKLVKNN